jgi:hypothetical protein
MTERPAPRKRQPKPRPLPTVLAALAVFGVAFEFLAFQLSSGKDPAVGAGVATGTPVARPAKKLVITKVIPARGGAAGAPTSSYASSGSVAAPAPVTTSSS